MIDRVLILSLGGCAVFGTLLVFELTSAQSDHPAAKRPLAPVVETPTPRAQRPQIDQLVATALDRPLFSETRKPPEQATAAGRPVDQELPNLRLTGIIIEPGRHLAIFAVSGAKPLVRSEGDTLDDWRLDTIGPRQVSLSGPTGVTTLEPKADPHLIRPSPPALPGATSAQPATPGRPPGPVALGRPPLPVGPPPQPPGRGPVVPPGGARGPVPPTQ
jgi:general secretion pathway protein N